MLRKETAIDVEMKGGMIKERKEMNVREKLSDEYETFENQRMLAAY